MKNIAAMMGSLRDMQAKIQQARDELDALTVTGEAGAGTVKVTLSGTGSLREVAIAPELMVPQDHGIVEDLIIAAHEEARRKMEQLAGDHMKSAAGGLPLPADFKLPF